MVLRFVGLLCMGIIITTAACNLSSDAAPTMLPTYTRAFADSPFATETSSSTDGGAQPTLIPLLDLTATDVFVTSVPPLGDACDVFITYAGARADNRLSMRSNPTVSAPQIFRVPNQVEVLRVPGSQEVAADGYRWLNVIYEASPQMRYQGWVARDSYEVSGVRDPSIATLQPTEIQNPC